MSLSIYRFGFISIVSLGIVFSIYVSVIYGIALALSLGFILAFAHNKRKRPSTKQKHTDRRAGEVYDIEQNEKRGEKNKKYKKAPNPNKKIKKKDDGNDFQTY